jgi:lysophospholipase L1-like esterase
MTDAGPSPRPRSGPRLIARVGLALGALLFALGLVEGALRVSGFEYHLYPESIQFGFPDPERFDDFFVPHDRYLWVQHNYEEKLAAAALDPPHLVLTGCSCTEWGFFDKDLVKLMREVPGGAPLKLLNLGVSGWSTYQGLQLMRRDVVALKPAVVTIFFGWNDHWMGFGVEDKTAADLTSSPLLMLLQKLRAVQFVTKAVVSRGAKEARRDGHSARPDRVSVVDFTRNLEQMVAVAREHGIVPVLITAPTSHRLGEEPEFLGERWMENLDELVPKHQRYVDAVRGVAAAQDVVLLDLEADFAALPRAKLLELMMEDGIHFTRAGGRRVANLLQRCLGRHGLLP